MFRAIRYGLRDHPGPPMAAVLTVLGCLAGLDGGGIAGALMGALMMGSCTWGPVLYTAWQAGRRKLHDNNQPVTYIPGE